MTLSKPALFTLVPALLLACSHMPQQRTPASSANPSLEVAPGLNEVRAQGASPDQLLGLYVNGAETPTFKFVESATQSIDIEIYEMGDRDFHAKLREALGKKVRIRIVKDPSPLGELCNYFAAVDPSKDDADCQDAKSLVAEIQRSPGGAFVAFNKPELCGIPGKTCFEHGKMIIVDGESALLSSGNFNSSNLCNLNQNPKTCNRDYSYVTRDPAMVTTLQAVFEHDLAGKVADLPSLIPASMADKLTVSPYSLEPLVNFIHSAKETIEIENQYLKEPKINQALIDAANAHVKVSIVVASLCSFGKPKAAQIPGLTALFTSLNVPGITTRIFTASMPVDGKAGYLHAKAIVVDGKYAWMGSVNGSTTSTSSNREYGVFFKNPEMVQHLRETILADHAHPQSETWQESLVCAKDRASATASSGDASNAGE